MQVPPPTYASGEDGPSAAPADLPSEASVLGRMAGENFPVASVIVGARQRRHLVALYGWARLVDQLGDDYPGDRLAALDWADAELTRALAGEEGLHPLISRAAAMVTAVGADPELLRQLVEANRIDQRHAGCATFADLVAYCRYSANPVGRMVLAIFGMLTPDRAACSDRICTALQIAEHTQDVAEDAAAGRFYLPVEDLERFGVDRGQLSGPTPAGPELRGLICFEVARARRILDEGAPLVASLRGRPRVAVAGFVAGGHAALDAIAARGFDPLGGTPRPSRTGLAAQFVRTWGRHAAGGSASAPLGQVA